MGIENQIERREHPPCEKCKGSGKVKNDKDKWVDCPACGGKGKIY